mmetsp:Transcript_29111/g.76875  ORF Transcript_29111/g.76875 Transcript_29111/m.76875 type:complete len:207 (+) Transcript_29111:619-1239(+)
MRRASSSGSTFPPSMAGTNPRWRLQSSVSELCPKRYPGSWSPETCVSWPPQRWPLSKRLSHLPKHPLPQTKHVAILPTSSPPRPRRPLARFFRSPQRATTHPHPLPEPSAQTPHAPAPPAATRQFVRGTRHAHHWKRAVPLTQVCSTSDHLVGHGCPEQQGLRCTFSTLPSDWPTACWEELLATEPSSAWNIVRERVLFATAASAT